MKQRVEAEKLKPKVVKVEEYIPTQEELLEEAEITEKENLKSLGMSIYIYQRGKTIFNLSHENCANRLKGFEIVWMNFI